MSKFRLTGTTHSVHLKIVEACKKKGNASASMLKICQDALKDYNLDKDQTAIDAYYILRFFYHFYKHAGNIHDLAQPSGNFLQSAALKAHVDAVTDANKSVFINSQIQF
jgi:hypothetical protein